MWNFYPARQKRDPSLRFAKSSKLFPQKMERNEKERKSEKGSKHLNVKITYTRNSYQFFSSKETLRIIREFILLFFSSQKKSMQHLVYQIENFLRKKETSQS